MYLDICVYGEFSELAEGARNKLAELQPKPVSNRVIASIFAELTVQTCVNRVIASIFAELAAQTCVK